MRPCRALGDGVPSYDIELFGIVPRYDQLGAVSQEKKILSRTDDRSIISISPLVTAASFCCVCGAIVLVFMANYIRFSR